MVGSVQQTDYKCSEIY